MPQMSIYVSEDQARSWDRAKAKTGLSASALANHLVRSFLFSRVDRHAAAACPTCREITDHLHELHSRQG